MHRCTHWISQFVRHTWLVFGLISFHYDPQTGRVWTTRRLTAYSALANVALVANIALLHSLQLPTASEVLALPLHQAVFAVITIIRSLAVLVTLLIGWLKRDEFMAVLGEFHRLRASHFRRLPLRPELLRRCERQVAAKFIASWAWMVCSFAPFVQSGSMTVLLIAASQWLLLCAINAALDQYFGAMIVVNLHFRMLNDELERIVRAAQRVTPQFTRASHDLADQLDSVATAHRQLQRLVERIIGIFEWQGACVFLSLYLSNIALVYIAYSVLTKGSAAEFNPVGTAMLWLAVPFYYCDLWCFAAVMIAVVQSYDRTAALIRLQWPTARMDERLESSFERFSMTLAGHPVHFSLLGFFDFNSKLLFTLFGSTVSHSIVLLQYDYQYNQD